MRNRIALGVPRLPPLGILPKLPPVAVFFRSLVARGGVGGAAPGVTKRTSQIAAVSNGNFAQHRIAREAAFERRGVGGGSSFAVPQLIGQ